jgi:hypothetical protein
MYEDWAYIARYYNQTFRNLSRKYNYRNGSFWSATLIDVRYSSLFFRAEEKPFVRFWLTDRLDSSRETQIDWFVHLFELNILCENTFLYRLNNWFRSV